MAHRIGAYTFCTMTGQVPPYRATAETLVRPGVDGTAIRLLGMRGPAFSLTTVRDVSNLATGRSLLDSYNTLIGEDPVVLVHSGVDYFAQAGVVVAVLGVDPLTLQKATVIAGALTSNSQAILRVRWNLQLVQA